MMKVFWHIHVAELTEGGGRGRRRGVMLRSVELDVAFVFVSDGCGYQSQSCLSPSVKLSYLTL